MAINFPLYSLSYLVAAKVKVADLVAKGANDLGQHKRQARVLELGVLAKVLDLPKQTAEVRAQHTIDNIKKQKKKHYLDQLEQVGLQLAHKQLSVAVQAQHVAQRLGQLQRRVVHRQVRASLKRKNKQVRRACKVIFPPDDKAIPSAESRC